MIQNFIYKTSKLIPILTKRVNTFSINNALKFSMNNNLFKITQANFADKKEKGEKGKKENKENTKNPKQEAAKKQENIKTQTNKAEAEAAQNQKKNKAENNIINVPENVDLEANEEEIDIEKEMNEDKDLTPEERKTIRKIFEALEEKDENVGQEKFLNALVKHGEKVLGIEEAFDDDREPKDFESTTVSHNYEKEFGAVSKAEKDFIEKVTKDFLRDYGIDAKEAEFLKERRPDILSYSLFDRLRDIKTAEDVQNYISDYTDYKNFEYTLERFDNLVQMYREFRDMENPAYVQARSMDRLLKNEQKMMPKERNVDTRQNALSDDYLKIQPRMKIDYAYNYEQNKEFKHTFDKIFQDDHKKLIEKMKLVKYIKFNPEKYGVRNRWLAKHFNVPIEKLPDYDVDIAGFKPEPKKKSRRKYQKRMADDISNYEAWRVFDRVPVFYSSEDVHYNLDLIPSNLIHRFGPASTPVFEESTGMYAFEDENLDIYVLIEFGQTTSWNGPNFTDDFYEEQNEKVQPKLHKKKWPTPEEFWESNELKKFKLFYHPKSDIKKFKRWLRYYVNRFENSKEQTIGQINEAEYGPLDDFSDYHKERKTTLINAIYNYSPSFFMDKDEKVYFKPEPLVPPKYISAEEGEFFDYDEYMKIEASKSKEMKK